MPRLRWILLLVGMVVIAIVFGRAAWIDFNAPRLEPFWIKSNEGHLDPDRSWCLAHDAGIRDLVLSPDGTRAYVLTSTAAVDMSAVLVWFTPHLLAALLTAIALAVTYRLWRRPPDSDHPHCRRCNYDVAHLPQRCPECGLELTARRRVRKRKPRRVVVAPLGFLAIALGNIAWQRGPIRDWADRIPCPTIASPAVFHRYTRTRHRQFMLDRQVDLSRVIEVDLESGAVIDVLLDESIGTYGDRLSISTDGSLLACVLDGTLRFVDTADGSTSVWADGDAIASVVAFSPASHEVYVAYSADRVIRFDVDTGHVVSDLNWFDRSSEPTRAIADLHVHGDTVLIASFRQTRLSPTNLSTTMTLTRAGANGVTPVSIEADTQRDRWVDITATRDRWVGLTRMGQVMTGPIDPLDGLHPTAETFQGVMGLTADPFAPRILRAGSENTIVGSPGLEPLVDLPGRNLLYRAAAFGPNDRLAFGAHFGNAGQSYSIIAVFDLTAEPNP